MEKMGARAEIFETKSRPQTPMEDVIGAGTQTETEPTVAFNYPPRGELVPPVIRRRDVHQGGTKNPFEIQSLGGPSTQTVPPRWRRAQDAARREEAEPVSGVPSVPSRARDLEWVL